MRWMFAAESRNELPKGTARRWAHHTKDMKKLPERVDGGDDDEKKAFAAAFILKCAAAGLTTPAQVAAAARGLIKTAVGPELGSLAGYAAAVPLAGTVVAPALLGGFGGALAGSAMNQTDKDDAKALRISAEANAYRRRAALAAAHAQVRKLLASDPKRYALIG